MSRPVAAGRFSVRDLPVGAARWSSAAAPRRRRIALTILSAIAALITS